MTWRRHSDPYTGDLFAYPTVPDPIPGSCDVDLKIRRALVQMLRNDPRDRFAIAADISRLADREITKNMLDAYAAPSREDHRFPAALVPAATVALQSHDLVNEICQSTGAVLLVGKDALDAELGKLQRQRDDATKKINELKRVMGDLDQ